MKYDAHNTTILTPPLAAVVSRKPGVRRILVMAIGTVGLLFVVLLGRHWWRIGRFIEETDDAFIGGDTTMIASKVSGFVMKIAAIDNHLVHAGDLLVQIDDRDYRAQLAKAEAMVEAQEAALENLEANAQVQVAVIGQARAQTVASAAEKWRAEADAARSRELVKTRVVSEQNFQQVDASASKASAADQASRATLLAAERQLAVIATQKKQTQAALVHAKAERELARLNLESTQIRSPIDGIVGNRQTQRGAYATAGSQLMSVVPTEGLWVEANFKESQLARLRSEQRVMIRADVLSEDEFEGRIENLAPATGAVFSLLPPQNATGNFTKIVQRVPVRIRLEGDAARLGKLRPGLSVVARVDLR